MVAPLTSNGEQPSGKEDRTASPLGEPWFYSFLERFAGAAMALGLILVGFAGMALFYPVFLLFSHGNVLTASFVLIGGALGIALLALLAIFQVALILLAVDTSRAVRDVRKNTSRSD